MKKAIDISYYQKNVDYKKVKESGIEMIILRAGFTGYGITKSKNKDKLFEEHYQGFKSVGIPIGVYWYSCAYTEEEAEEEALKVLEIVKNKEIELPIFIDVEDNHDTTKSGLAKQNQYNLSRKELTKVVAKFCEIIEKNGYYVGIYASTYWLNKKLDMNILKRYDIWVAHWNVKKPTYTGDYGIWQYTSKGKINGINGYVDLDYVYKTYPDIIRNKGLNNLSKEMNSISTNDCVEKNIYYKVKKGDNLTKIAKKYNIDVKTLYHQNKDVIGNDPNKIYPGQKLIVLYNSL